MDRKIAQIILDEAKAQITESLNIKITGAGSTTEEMIVQLIDKKAHQIVGEALGHIAEKLDILINTSSPAVAAKPFGAPIEPYSGSAKIGAMPDEVEYCPTCGQHISTRTHGRVELPEPHFHF
jgi:hypothetical protein